MNSSDDRDDPLRTTPVGLLRYAAEFLEAGLAADDSMGSRPGYERHAPIPVMFLTGQSIELALKAFLIHKGVTLRDLRTRYVHDLARCLRKAKELGLHEVVRLTDDEQESIRILSPLYAGKELQYIRSGYKVFPVHGPLGNAALRLVHGVGALLNVPARILEHLPSPLATDK